MWNYVFSCDKNLAVEELTALNEICDGETDCTNGADEAGCPDRFYCSPNSSIDWVSLEKLCDHVKDCPNGQDECGTCYMGPLSSTEFLIHSKIVLFSTGFAGLLMVVLNSIVGIECYRSEPSNKAGRIDRIMRLQVNFFDGLMGFYNILIVVATLVLKSKGQYCLSDQSWRASIYCSGLGILFSVSSHGSLMAIGLMSVIRCITCTNVASEVRQSIVLSISGILLAVNLVNSIMPVLPIASVQDIFRSQSFFTHNFQDNPFISSGIVNFSRLHELHEEYYSSSVDTYTTIVNLNEITSERGLFDVLEISYYGNNRMCTQNVFKIQDSYLIYKILYLIIVVAILIVVSLTYMIILYKKIQSNQKLRDLNAAQDPAVMNDEIYSMKTKIFLMIGTQLLSWMSFILAAVYYHFSGENPPPNTFEIFSLVVIPLNSILNPIFYSGIYKKSLAFFSQCRKIIVAKVEMLFSVCRTKIWPADIEMQDVEIEATANVQPEQMDGNAQET